MPLKILLNAIIASLNPCTFSTFKKDMAGCACANEDAVRRSKEQLLCNEHEAW